MEDLIMSRHVVFREKALEQTNSGDAPDRAVQSPRSRGASPVGRRAPASASARSAHAASPNLHARHRSLAHAPRCAHAPRLGWATSPWQGEPTCAASTRVSIPEPKRSLASGGAAETKELAAREARQIHTPRVAHGLAALAARTVVRSVAVLLVVVVAVAVVVVAVVAVVPRVAEALRAPNPKRAVRARSRAHAPQPGLRCSLGASRDARRPRVACAMWRRSARARGGADAQ